MAQPIKVRILDQEYLGRSEETAEEVQRVADFVNQVAEEIRESTEGLNERKVAILAAMHIAGEYFQALKGLEKNSGSTDKRTKDMIYDIDSALEHSVHGFDE